MKRLPAESKSFELYRSEEKRPGAGPRSKYVNAVGLAYDPSHYDAPVISVKACAASADQLVRIAERFGIPVVERKEVARSLVQLEEGREIPEALYEAVALIFNGLERAFPVK